MTLEMFGCTTPFGRYLDNICSGNDSNVTKPVANLWYDSLYHPGNYYQSCPYPCTQYKIKGNLEEDFIDDTQRPQRHDFFFPEYIRVTTARWSYSELELLAELGGYIGLFLGMSVFQISSIFDRLLDFLLKTPVKHKSNLANNKTFLKRQKTI